MYINLNEQRELLEEEAMLYLYALIRSVTFGRDENREVYLRKGTLSGMCRIFGAYFEVELRRKITFYKGIYPGEGKFWFEVINESISTEEAKQMEDSYLKKVRELAKMQSCL